MMRKVRKIAYLGKPGEPVAMSKFSAIVCDHCDARDIIDSPVVPQHHIASICIQIDDISANVSRDRINADLCEKCYEELKQAVFRLTTQQPREVPR